MVDLVKNVMQALQARGSSSTEGLGNAARAQKGGSSPKSVKRELEAAARAALAAIDQSGFILMPRELAPLGLNVEGIPHPIYMLPPAKSARQSVIALSLAKAGSTMFFALLEGICARSDLTYVNFTNSYFLYGVDPARLPRDEGRMYQPYGYCYGGFRSLPIGYDAHAVRGMKKMLLVRDMRDILVSRYFSSAYVHPMPGTVLDRRYRRQFVAERHMLLSQDVDAGVLALAPEYRQFWDCYKQALACEEFRVWRYEDVVFDKARFAREICDFFGIALGEEAVSEIVAPQNVFPRRERRAFIRNVAPGDYKIKLSQSVIAWIDERFADYQTLFGYVGGSPRRK